MSEDWRTEMLGWLRTTLEHRESEVLAIRRMVEQLESEDRARTSPASVSESASSDEPTVRPVQPTGSGTPNATHRPGTRRSLSVSASDSSAPVATPAHPSSGKRNGQPSSVPRVRPAALPKEELLLLLASGDHWVGFPWDRVERVALTVDAPLTPDSSSRYSLSQMLGLPPSAEEAFAIVFSHDGGVAVVTCERVGDLLPVENVGPEVERVLWPAHLAATAPPGWQPIESGAAGPGPESPAEAESEGTGELEAGAETELEPAPEAEAGPEPGPSTGPEPGTEREPDPESALAPAAESAPEPAPAAESTLEPESEPESAPEPAVESASDPEPEPGVLPEVEAEWVPVAEAVPMAAAEPDAGTHPDEVVATEGGVVPAVAGESGAATEPASGTGPAPEAAEREWVVEAPSTFPVQTSRSTKRRALVAVRYLPARISVCRTLRQMDWEVEELADLERAADRLAPGAFGAVFVDVSQPLPTGLQNALYRDDLADLRWIGVGSRLRMVPEMPPGRLAEAPRLFFPFGEDEARDIVASL